MIDKEILEEAMELIKKQELTPYEALDISIKYRISDNLREIVDYLSGIYTNGLDINNG